MEEGTHGPEIKVGGGPTKMFTQGYRWFILCIRDLSRRKGTWTEYGGFKGSKRVRSGGRWQVSDVNVVVEPTG